jgi:Domain of unknown function (DUF4345)
MITRLALVLKLMAVACLVPALLHGFLGVGGDFLIGALHQGFTDPTLDSQNRFYGVAFGAYAVILWMAASDIRRFAPVLRILFAMMFLAGCARFLSLAAHGWPSSEVLFLWSTEIVLPPVLWFWVGRYEVASD